MADYRVNLDIFAGPLDLLLFLIRKEEVDIYDIPIARITDQYLQYVEMLKQLDIDSAGSFLVMAATLMEIKSAMLLPRAEPEGLDSELTSDPRAALVRQLFEYKKFKDAAGLLDAAAVQQSQRFARPATIMEQFSKETNRQVDIDQISLWDLLEAFDSILKATGFDGTVDHIKDDTPIDLYQIEILHRLQTEGPMVFERIFENKGNRAVMIGLFLALLELIREGLVWAEQPKTFASVYLRSLTAEPAEQAVQKAIVATEEQGLQAHDNKEARNLPIPFVELPAKPKHSKPVGGYGQAQSSEDKKSK